MDIYSPRGRRAVEIARERLKSIEKERSVSFTPFSDDHPSPFDGVIIKDGWVKAAYEVRTRNAKIEENQLMYWGKPFETILITAEKIDTCVKIAASLYLPFHLIIVFTNTTLLWEVSDCNGKWKLGEVEKKKTKTQKTINGGKAVRENYFIPIEKSIVLC